VIGDPAEDERADHLTEEVDRSEEPNIAGCEMKGSLLDEDGADKGNDLDLETVENP